MKNIRKVVVAIFALFLLFQAEAQNTDALFNKAKGLVLAQNYKEALSEYQVIFESQEGDSAQLSEAYGYTGICYDELGETEDAWTYYKKALDYKVPFLLFYDKAIALTQKEKKNDEHEWVLNEKVKYFPDFEMEVERDLNSHYLRTKQYRNLLLSSEKMMQWYPNSAKYDYYRGLAYQNEGKMDSAELAYRSALEKDADYTSANIRLGYLIFEEGNRVFSNEKGKYDAIAKPSRLDYSNYLKSLEKGKVKYREAEKYLLKAYAEEEDANLKKILATLYTRLGETEKASKYK